MSNDRTEHREILNKHGIKLDPLTIHSKDFGVRLRGYDQEEVDDFLDEIIRDYEQMVKIIEDLAKQAEHTMMVNTREVSRETKQFDVLKPKQPEPAVERNIPRDEITMLKVRLANLERKVFGSSRSE
jgi:DivIVA domain-containing protein